MWSELQCEGAVVFFWKSSFVGTGNKRVIQKEVISAGYRGTSKLFWQKSYSRMTLPDLLFLPFLLEVPSPRMVRQIISFENRHFSAAEITPHFVHPLLKTYFR